MQVSSFQDRKTKLDEFIDKLRADIQVIKQLDKDLTRQFIQLGNNINLLKQKNDIDDFHFEEENLLKVGD